MKFAKLYTVMACAAALCGMVSCSDVTEPVLQKPDPETFKMNTPPLQDQYIKLSETGTFNLTLNGQPSYGFSAVTQYRAQVSMTGKFDTETDYRELTPTGTGTLSQMTFNDIDLAEALCDLRGIKEEDQYTDLGEQKVYFRGVAFIDGVPESHVVTSNIVSLNRVQSFFSVAKPGVIYVIGNYAGAWIGPTADQAENLIPYSLSEKDDQIRSKVYYGSILFDPAATEKKDNEDVVIQNTVFRFYTALTGWEDDTMGCAGGKDADTPVEFDDFKAGSTLEHDITKTKDSFQFNGYRGSIDFTVNLNTMKAIMTAPAAQ